MSGRPIWTPFFIIQGSFMVWPVNWSDLFKFVDNPGPICYKKLILVEFGLGR